MIVRGGPNACALGSGVVVRLVGVRAAGCPTCRFSASSAASTLSRPQPVSASRPVAALAAASRRSTSVAERSSSHADLVGRERRVDARAGAPPRPRPAAPRTTCRSRRGTSAGPQSEYGSRAADERARRSGSAGSSRRRPRRARRCRRRAGRGSRTPEPSRPRAARRRRSRAAATAGQSAKLHGVAGESAPLPTADDDDDALRVRVRDRVALERRERVERRVVRVAHAAEAEVDHPRALVGRPA